MHTTNIVRVTAGALNKVNDSVIGQITANIGPKTSRFVSQLGAGVWFGPDTIIYDASVGTLYAGHYRYVRLASGASTPVVGQIAFWDTIANAADNLYQVTTSEAGSTDTAKLVAGVFINALTVGNYGFICDTGLCYVKFRGTLSNAGAAGSSVYAAAAGAGADLGLADVLAATADGATPILQARYLGVAAEAPTSGGLKRVYLNPHNIRG